MRNGPALILGLLLLGQGSAQAAAVIVAKGTPIETLDQDAIKRIFLGRQPALDGRAVVVVMRRDGTLRTRFDAEVLGRPGSQLTSYWSKLVFTGKARAPEEEDSDAGVRERVAQTPGAIGYVESTGDDSRVRAVFEF